jgi:hypothetical protein
VAIWLLVWICLIVSCFTFLNAVYGSESTGPTTWIVVGVTLAIAIVGIVFEARNDLYGTAKSMTALGGLGAILAFFVGLYANRFADIALVVSGLLAILFLTSFLYLLYNQFRDGEVPNVLRERFGRSNVVEVDGVQMSVLTGGTTVVHGGHIESVRVVLQNCWDAPREAVVRLSEDTRIFLGKSGDILFPDETEISLGPAEVVAVKIPIAAEPDARGRFSIDLRLDVSGRGGERVRPWRAGGLSRPVPWWVILLLAPVGALVWGGGIKIKVSARPQEAPDVVLPDPLREVIWRPE